MLTYKKALNLLASASVSFVFEYQKTTDIKSAMSRRQGSRHPLLMAIRFNFGNDTEIIFDALGFSVGGLDNVDFEHDIRQNYPNDLISDSFDSWLYDVTKAIEMLLPEILDNYVNENAEEIEE